MELKHGASVIVMGVIAFLVILLIRSLPRYEMVVVKDAKENLEWVYRLNRVTGRVSRYAFDGTCVDFPQHCAFENSP